MKKNYDKYSRNDFFKNICFLLIIVDTTKNVLCTCANFVLICYIPYITQLCQNFNLSKTRRRIEMMAGILQRKYLFSPCPLAVIPTNIFWQQTKQEKLVYVCVTVYLLVLINSCFLMRCDFFLLSKCAVITITQFQRKLKVGQFWFLSYVEHRFDNRTISY